MHAGRKPLPLEQTASSMIRRCGRQLSIFLRPEEYTEACRAAADAGVSVSRWIAEALRGATPELRIASAEAGKSLLLRLSRAEEERDHLRVENARLRRMAQPEARIGERGTKGDIYFSVPLFLLEHAIEWGQEHVDSMDRELKRETARSSRDARRISELRARIGAQQGVVDIYEAMRDRYTARKRVPAG